MKLTLLPWAVAPALVAPLLLSDTSALAGEHGLLRVESQKPAAQNAPALESWKDRLGSRDLDQRESAYADFVEALRRDPALMKAAQGWRDGSDSDLAWTTRLALREAHDARADSPFQSRYKGQGPDRDEVRSRILRSHIDEMQRRFGDLDRMFDDFERRLNQNSGGMGFGAQPFTRHGTTAEHHGYKLQISPDGVKVEIEENVDGQRETKTYTAKSLEELYDEYPELKDKIGGGVEIHHGPRAWWQTDKDDPSFGVPGVPPSGSGSRATPPLPLPGGLRTDRLGVGVGEFTADEREEAQLEEGVGLKVASVDPNSVASKLGIEVGDVIVEVNGRTIKGAPDVLDVLSQRGGDQNIVVTLVDVDGKKRTMTWQPAKPSGGKIAPEKRNL